jgi:hypothetical protein
MYGEKSSKASETSPTASTPSDPPARRAPPSPHRDSPETGHRDHRRPLRHGGDLSQPPPFPVLNVCRPPGRRPRPAAPGRTHQHARGGGPPRGRIAALAPCGPKCPSPPSPRWAQAGPTAPSGVERRPGVLTSRLDPGRDHAPLCRRPTAAAVKYINGGRAGALRLRRRHRHRADQPKSALPARRLSFPEQAARRPVQRDPAT